jgi:type II secretory pathway pseudopilin PulG
MPLQRSTLKLFRPRPLAVKHQGWTLIEIAAVTVMVGIMAAIAMPSMLGMQARSDLKDAQNQVKGALQGAQRIAIKKGQSCAIRFTTTGVTAVDSTSGCVPNPVTLDTGMSLEWRSGDSGSFSSSGNQDLTFSYRGNPDNANNLWFVLKYPSRTPEQKCIVMSAGLGIMRSGYIDGTNCTAAF